MIVVVKIVQDVVVCCPNDYGFNSLDNGAGNGDMFAGGGCYVKTVCFNPFCIGLNMNMTLLREWSRREIISSALCNGVMNYFWENAWITGFLYQFQFKAKLEFDQATQTYDGRYCKKVVYLHPTEWAFYYRSTPFNPDPTGNSALDTFMGDDDGVYAPWWTFGGGAWSSGQHARGDQQCHILFPTTITDMGSKNQCIQQICLEEKFAEECSVTDQIGSTTFQDITELVSDIYNAKSDWKKALLVSFFNRPEKEIGGDVAQALMQNCMLGTVVYETNMGGVDCDCSGTPPPTAASNLIEYPPVNDIVGGGAYVPNAVNIVGDWSIQWAPLMFTASTQTIMSAYDLEYCLLFGLSASTQEIPFYYWGLWGGIPWGDQYNDWTSTYGKYQKPHSMTSAVSNFLPFALVKWNNTSDAGVWNQCAIYPGDFQNAMGLGTGGIQWGNLLGRSRTNEWNTSNART